MPPICLTLLSALLVGQQAPPRDTPPAPDGVASVSGRVTDRETGRPLRRMRVRFAAAARRLPPSDGTFETTTDAEGSYHLKELPAGEYYVSAGPDEYGAGHQWKSYSDREPAPPLGPGLQLAPGEERTGVDFALSRTYAVEGTVVNEYGEPLAEVTVYATNAAGGSAGRPGTTDDRGHFRLYGLPPGGWRICAAGGDTEGATGGDALRSRFVRTCYPPATAGRSVLALESSDLTGVLVTLVRERAYAVSGVVVDANGAPVEQAAVSIERLEQESYSRGSINPEVSRGAFVARGLTPGEYVVRASVHDRSATEYRPGPPVPLEMGHAIVRVEGADVTGVLIATMKGISVPGRLVFDGGPPPLRGHRLGIYARREPEAERIFQTSAPFTAVNDDFTFELAGLYGPVILTPENVPSGWLLRSVRYGDADITDLPTEFQAGPQPRGLVITLTNRIASVAARAVDEKGAPVSDALVVLLPVDRSRWRAGSARPLVTQRDGTATGSRVPGDYLAAAVVSQDMSRAWRSSDVVKAIAERARPVTLREGENRIEVAVVRLPEG